MTESRKRYYWLQLGEDFFRQKEIKMLRTIAGGDTYTIIYLKMMLLSLKEEGMILYEGVADSFAEEVALEIDEEVKNVEIAINYLISKNLIKKGDFDAFMNDVPSMIGSETDSARRMRKHRELKKQKALEQPKVEQGTLKEVGPEQWEQDFEEWWELYDRKIKKKDSKPKFKKHHKKYGYERIRKGTELYLKTIRDKQFKMHPTTFLNGEVFNDQEGLQQLATDSGVGNRFMNDKQRSQYSDLY